MKGGTMVDKEMPQVRTTTSSKSAQVPATAARVRRAPTAARSTAKGSPADMLPEVSGVEPSASAEDARPDLREEAWQDLPADTLPDASAVGSPAPAAEEARPNPLAALADLATPMAVRVAATLRIADHLPATAGELASAVGADAGALDRVLRHLVTAGVLAREADADRYVLTGLGAGLRANHPAGLRARWDVEGALGHVDLSFTRLLHSVRTGASAYQEQYGTPLWAALSADPARATLLDEQTGAAVGPAASQVVSAYDWGALGHVVDVGGGDGTLVIALLNEYPALRGTVLELPGPAEVARKMLDAAGLADRANAVAGDFLDSVPAGAEGYLLCSVLHQWGDEDARTILRNCAAAAGEDGALFVVERVADGVDTERDLRGLVLHGGGRERDTGELSALAESAGLTATDVHTAGAVAIVELAVA